MATINPITPVAAGIQPPQQMSLGDMMNVARGAQAYQQAEQINPLALQKAQMEVEQAQKLNPLTVRRSTAETASAETGAQSTALDFANKQSVAIANRLTGLINNPLIIASEQNPDVVDPAKLQDIIKKYAQEQATSLGIPKNQADMLIQPYLDQTQNPAGVRQFLKDKLLSTLDQGSRLSALQPSGIAVNTGAGGATVAQNIFGPQVPGTALPGTTFVQQLPPTTQVTDPLTGQTRLIGPVGGQATPLTTNVPPLQAAALTAGAGTIGSDITATTKAAQEAPSRIAIFQNIKKFAPDSFTGVGGQRKELAAGILNAIGIPAYEQQKVNTEELSKNSALLALAGGNTDAARALAEIATPNKKLNAKAILAIADQMIGIENMAIAKSNYLSPVQNDAVQYGQRKLQFDAISDPRIFQEMTAEDVAKLKASMSPAQIDEMTRKVRMAKQLGVIK